MKSGWFVLPLLLLFLLPAQAAVYRWTDASGQVHYSDAPGPHVRARKMNSLALGPAAPKQAGNNADQASGTEAGDVRTHKCAQARHRLAQYQQADSLKRRGADGKMHKLTPKQQIAAIVNMQNNVQAFCGKKAQDNYGDTARSGDLAGEGAGTDDHAPAAQ